MVAIYNGTEGLYEFEAITVEAITLPLPIKQDATPGSFVESLNLSWTLTTNNRNTLQFHNLCALAKLSVDSAGFGNIETLTIDTEAGHENFVENGNAHS